MQKQNVRLEVMNCLAQKMDNFMDDYLMPIETNWQPSDFLPDSSNENFFEEVKQLQELARELPYDYWAVLIGDTITEEALPTYESWLMAMDGVSPSESQGWSRWVRSWTAEENRHGDLLNKYLYLSGRVNMRAVETSTQYLIADGFDIGTSSDPYKNFIYTSFQELATNISHRRTASLAKNYGNNQLSRMCGQIAADEMRHAKAYKTFVANIFEIDASEMMIAFSDMMKLKIVMPAHFLRELNGAKSSLYEHFSDAAQRVGVYTTNDYISIMESLIKDWGIDKLSDLNDSAEKARDYLMLLPDRLKRVAERMKTPSLEYQFSWIN
ncbi:acyl-[acyl-carrier-protein] desaturase [Pseudarcicella hirudinis]|uniref:Acyl-[acyl-carrier-protein] desaturase n=1 Tax=Pseudarcicella hirudinis TaxID=1079859 RepID=A0A1I5S471_9BACT|nr:acyl-ACP desaturase [Pseudarcicella hirudinis]SFP65401.1 acyl-[acyl-carrier-protein] desaturase [Pseudarcicella hirudinis]